MGVGGREALELREQPLSLCYSLGLQSGPPPHQKIQLSFYDKVLRYSLLTLHFQLHSCFPIVRWAGAPNPMGEE